MNKTVASDHLYRTLSMYFGLFVAIGCFLVLPFFVPGVWPYTSILVPVIFALILSFFWKPFCYRLHQKGYTPPIFLSLFLILYAGPLAVGYILLIIINHLSNLWNVAMLSVLIGLAGPAAALLILTVLPKKHWRSWGKRQAMFPFRLLGLLALGLGMIWLIAYLCRGFNIHNLGNGIQGLIWFYTISSILFYFARRQNLPSLEEVVTKDPRAPVVYLRSFSDEGKAFVYTVGDELRQYTRNSMNTFKVTLEQYFTTRITKSIGPFVALGNPEDYLAPEGAYRLYASDENWQEKFWDLATNASIILMQPGSSANLKWELDAIRTSGLYQKMLIVTPPAKRDGWQYGAVNMYRWMDETQEHLAGGIPKWQEFASILTVTGYLPPEENPGCGVVLGFDKDARGIKLYENADSPDEYLSAMKNWLDTRQQGELSPE